MALLLFDSTIFWIILVCRRQNENAIKENACKREREREREEEKRGKEKGECNEKVKMIKLSKELIFHFFSTYTTFDFFISGRLIATIS